jgi:hypothetical protein
LRQARFEPTKRIVFHALEGQTDSCPASLLNPGYACWLGLQSQFDIAAVKRVKGKDIARRVRPADAA